MLIDFYRLTEPIDIYQKMLLSKVIGISGKKVRLKKSRSL